MFYIVRNLDLLCKLNQFCLKLICSLLPVFRPISANAKLRMNPRSDVDFSSPKVDLTVNLSEVAIELNKPQVSVSLDMSKPALLNLSGRSKDGDI